MAWGAFENFSLFERDIEHKVRDKTKMVPFELDGRKINLRSRPFKPMNYFRVMKLAQRGYEPLSPFDLECLTTSSYKEEPLLIREGQQYFVMNDPPYWTSHGMGIIFDPDEQEPHQFRGKFVIAEVKKVDITTGRTFPNYDKVIVLGISDLEKMLENRFSVFQIEEKTGLSIPVYKEKSSRSVKRLLKEDSRDRYDFLGKTKGALLIPFAPIVGGFKAGESSYSLGNFYTSDPRVRYPVWVNKIGGVHTP